LTAEEPIHHVIDRLARAHEADLVALRHRLHGAPELSNREERTAALIAERLTSAGVDEVRTGIAGHGVVGVLRGGRPGDRVIALRADMDGLPVRETTGLPFASTVVDPLYPGGPFPVAHACGHDCHMAVVVTSAAVLGQVRDRLAGTVLFLFQPAEEGPPIGEVAGAQAMLDVGALSDPAPTMVFGMHVLTYPRGTVVHRRGAFFAASSRVRIVVSGVQVHASTPWLGVDPMPAAAGIITGIGQLYRQVPAQEAVTVSIGHVEDVGRFNILGDTVTLSGTIRCLSQDDLPTVQERLRRLAEGQAAAFGCTAQVDFVQTVPAVRNDPAWIDALLPTVRRVVGEDHVVEVPPFMGYDDVSVFLDAFGGAYLGFGVQDTRMEGDRPVPLDGGRGLAPNHHPGFYASDASLVTSLRIHAHVAVDHLAGAIDVRT
jgi:amidohydrolase